jgi:predicted O-methyltransferase YrrM
MFKGTNFVFDGRLGRQITEDALGTCVTCGAETSLVSNCRNDNCHQRIIQCESCRTGFHGTCSTACKNRILNGVMAPRRLSNLGATSVASPDHETTPSDGQESPTYDNLEDYSAGHSSPVPSIYKEIELNTRTHLASGSHMVSGASQGRLLTQLASMTRNGRILELGTFTGYATACLLEGARNVGQSTGVASTSDKDEGGPYVLTMERDRRAFNLAAAHLTVIGQHGFGEVAAEAVCALRGCHVDDVDDDLVSVNVDEIATCHLLRVTDALATVESIASGTNGDSLVLQEPFDMVFVDADKTRLLDYVEACLTSDRLLRRGGLIVVDNVLWKGLVLEAGTGDFTSFLDQNDSELTELRSNRRARKLATTMHRFNEAVVKDDRVDVLVLPIRDGLSVIRKK